MKRVIVCGGRKFDDRMLMARVLDRVVEQKGEIFVIQGGANGADKLAGEWAASRGIPCAEVAAPWAVYGDGAGPIRNGWMLALQPDGVVAFPGGAGTANLIKQARDAGVPVMEVGKQATKERLLKEVPEAQAVLDHFPDAEMQERLL